MAMRFVTALSAHWLTDVPTTASARLVRARMSPSKSTEPAESAQSTASPEKTGTSNVVTTTATARANEATSTAPCGRR